MADADPTELVASLRDGDRRALARAISIVEDERSGHRRVLAAAYRMGGTSLIAGITGAPGAGKSTLTNALIREVRTAGTEVAVLAVDPTSPFTGGAILGDRVRMQDHIADRGVYIRSMASRGQLGGLAAATPKVLTLLDGADGAGITTVTRGRAPR